MWDLKCGGGGGLKGSRSRVGRCFPNGETEKEKKRFKMCMCVRVFFFIFSQPSRT